MIFENSGQQVVCGLDEAGRGPLAGPVVAAAVVLPDDFPVEILGDSKKLSEKKRELAERVIKEKAWWAVAEVDHKTIDKINILQASLLAMKNAFELLEKKLPQGLEIIAIADGLFVPEISATCKAIPKADALYAPVMAASIIAKTHRDCVMCEFDALYPEYGYRKHKGYPTPAHKKICREIGASPIQRLSFKY